MEATVKLTNLRHSAKKLRPLARLFVGKNLETALNATAVMSQDSARYLNQALKMAKAAAESKELMSGNTIIKEIMANEGSRIKRMRPNARGRANSYQKHLAHLTVTVAEAPAKPAKTVAKKEEK